MLDHRVNRKLTTFILDYSSLLTLISLAWPLPKNFNIVVWPSPHILLSVCRVFILQVTVYTCYPFAGSSCALFVHFSIPIAELFPDFTMLFLLWHLPCAALYSSVQPCFLTSLMSFIWMWLSWCDAQLDFCQMNPKPIIPALLKENCKDTQWHQDKGIS